jgi:phosphopantetheinyl transferase
MEIMDPPKGPRMILARLRIGDYESSLSEEIERATSKRKKDHNTGRFLLENCIGKLNLPIDSLEVLRTEERAPYLSWIEGIWNNSPLPGISIGHSGDWAVCALIEAGWWIGIDAEPANRGIQENAFDMMASGEELAWIRENPDQAIRIWTAKEAIQKAERMGMNLNPRQINIDDYEVHSFLHDDLMVSVAWRPAGKDPRTPEDDLLDATLEKMKENPDFTVGCATTRGNC